MEISYKNRKLEKQLTDPKEMTKSFGQLARKVNQRHNRCRQFSDYENHSGSKMPRTDRRQQRRISGRCFRQLQIDF